MVRTARSSLGFPENTARAETAALRQRVWILLLPCFCPFAVKCDGPLRLVDFARVWVEKFLGVYNSARIARKISRMDLPMQYELDKDGKPILGLDEYAPAEIIARLIPGKPLACTVRRWMKRGVTVYRDGQKEKLYLDCLVVGGQLMTTRRLINQHLTELNDLHFKHYGIIPKRKDEE